MVVWQLRASLVACEGLDLLHAFLWCSLDGRMRVLQTSGRSGIFGFSRDRLRWGEVYVAPQAERRVLASFWMFDDGVWRVKLVCGGLGWKMAGVWIFGQKKG